MPNNTLVKDAVGATLDFWQTAPNGVTLAAKAGDLAHANEPTSTAARVSFAATVVQAVDGLVRPVIELANLTRNTTGAAAELGGVVLKRAGFAAALIGWGADTKTLIADFNDPQLTDIQKESKYEALKRPGFSGGSLNWVMPPYRGFR